MATVVICVISGHKPGQIRGIKTKSSQCDADVFSPCRMTASFNNFIGEMGATAWDAGNYCSHLSVVCLNLVSHCLTTAALPDGSRDDATNRRTPTPKSCCAGCRIFVWILFELIRCKRMDATFGNCVQSCEWLGGAIGRGLLGGAEGRSVEEGVSSSECVAVDDRHWYRHKLGKIVVSMLSTDIQKFELDTGRRVVELGGGSG